MTIEKQFGLESNYHIPPGSKEFYCGCEFEIESVVKISEDVKALFGIEVDNSLRNNGREFKTLPIDFGTAINLFDILHKGLSLGKDPFSDRTSIHVHVNVRQFEPTQLRQMVLCYALLEPLFFHFVGEERKNSIYCVPLNYTYMPSIYKDDLAGMRKKWHKYTAFNLKPIAAEPDSPGLGTVEFRHLYGTADKKVFSKWLTAIHNLYTFINNTPNFNIIEEIKTGKSAAQFAKQIIPTLAFGLADFQINEMCKDTMLDVKLSVGGLAQEKKPVEKKPLPAPPAFVDLQAVQNLANNWGDAQEEQF